MQAGRSHDQGSHAHWYCSIFISLILWTSILNFEIVNFVEPVSLRWMHASFFLCFLSIMIKLVRFIRKWFEPRSNIPWLKMIIWVTTASQWLLYLLTHQIHHQGFWIFNWPKLCYHLTLKVRFVCFYLPVHVAYPRVLWLSCFHSLLLAGVCKTFQLSQFCNPCRYSIECLLLTCSAMRCAMFLLIPDRLRWWPLSHLRWIIHLR